MEMLALTAAVTRWGNGPLKMASAIRSSEKQEDLLCESAEIGCFILCDTWVCGRPRVVQPSQCNDVYIPDQFQFQIFCCHAVAEGMNPEELIS